MGLYLHFRSAENAMRFLAALISLALSSCCVAQDATHLPPNPANAAREIPAMERLETKSPTLVSAKLSSDSEGGELRAASESTAALVPAPEPAYRLERAPQHRAPELRTIHRRSWVLLTAAQHGSALFDAWSTRQALSSGHGYERDILVRPFANSAAVYPALQILPLGLDFLSYRMLQSSHSFNRKIWWIPQAVASAGFVWCGTRNLRVAH